MAKQQSYRPSARKERPVASIRFEPGHEFCGAEIEAALTAPLGFLLDIQGIGDASPSEQRQLIKLWGDSVLIGWNIEDSQGMAMPANGDGLLQQETSFVTAILTAWAETVTSPPAPLVQPSRSGTMLAAR